MNIKTAIKENKENYILTETDKLKLFKIIYKSGYMCYTALNSDDFINNWDQVYFDLKIIAKIVNNVTLKEAEEYFKITLSELYLIDGVSFKDLI